MMVVDERIDLERDQARMVTSDTAPVVVIEEGIETREVVEDMAIIAEISKGCQCNRSPR